MVVKVIQFYTFILFGKKYRKKYRKNIYTFWEKVSQKYILFGKKYRKKYRKNILFGKKYRKNILYFLGKNTTIT